MRRPAHRAEPSARRGLLAGRVGGLGPGRRRRSAGALTLALLALACGTDEARYCTADDDCPSNRCTLGTCAPADGSLPDGAPVAGDGGAIEAGVRDDVGAPLDAAADAALPDAALPDGAVDAGPEPCAGDDVWFARCDAHRVRRVECVQGIAEAGPCLAIPPAACGAVCEGCGVGGEMADGVTRRQSYELLADAFFDLGPFDPPTRAERCSGCRWGYTGFTDETCRIEHDAEGRPTQRTCLYCARDQMESTAYTVEPGRLQARTTCGPEGRVTGELAYVLDGQGRLDQIELSDGSVRAVEGPGGLLAALETRDGQGALRARWSFHRGEDGRLLEARLDDGFGGPIRRRERYDYGCWRCAAERCRLGAPPGCVALPGALPSTYLCGPGERACPEGLDPAWLEDYAEAAWILNGIDAEVEPWVGAQRVEGTYTWSAVGGPVPEPLLPAPGADGVDCALLGARPGPVELIGHAGQRDPQLVPRACDDVEPRMTLCRAR